MAGEFLSDGWFRRLAALLAEAEPSQSAGTTRVGQLVTGAPEGCEYAWTLVLEHGSRPRVEVGSIESADVVLVEPFEAALALASGHRSANELLEAGHLKLRGDARRLVAVLDDLQAVVAASGSPVRGTAAAPGGVPETGRPGDEDAL